MRHHWVAYVRPALEVIGAVRAARRAPFVNVNVAWFFLVVAFGLLAHAAWCAVRGACGTAS